MSKPLPGLGGADWRVTDKDRYQDIANRACATVHSLLHGILRVECAGEFEAGHASGDGGPIVSGALGGILEFYLDSETTDAEIRSRINGLLDDLLPQLRMSRMANGMQEGRA